jgi:hypothetical protein
MKDFWVITTYFNYAKYKSMLNNWIIFSDALKRSGINLLTLELSYDGSFQLPPSDNVIRLSGSSVMWQKERLINLGLSLLPESCTKYAWADCDVLFEDDNWAKQACRLLDEYDIVQLFKRVYYLKRGVQTFSNNPEDRDLMIQGVIWQYKTHKDWLQRRRKKDLSFSSPGFAWAARRSSLDQLYDRNIIGSGDTFLVDFMLNSWDIHGYARKFTSHMKSDMEKWCKAQKKLSVHYVPQTICHLWHGSLKNRAYMDRHELLKLADFDPCTDIELSNGVYEWASDKKEFHGGIIQYFLDRKEDEQ